MRPASLLIVLAVLAAVPALSAGPAPANPTSSPGIEAEEVPLTQAGVWAVSPQLSRRLVQVSPGVYVAVKGKHERRHVRVARWIEGLSGDRRATYASAGFPVYRYRELAENHLFEYWTYPDRRLTYVFEGDRLVGTEPF